MMEPRDHRRGAPKEGNQASLIELWDERRKFGIAFGKVEIFRERTLCRYTLSTGCSCGCHGREHLLRRLPSLASDIVVGLLAQPAAVWIQYVWHRATSKLFLGN